MKLLNNIAIEISYFVSGYQQRRGIGYHKITLRPSFLPFNDAPETLLFLFQVIFLNIGQC